MLIKTQFNDKIMNNDQCSHQNLNKERDCMHSVQNVYKPHPLHNHKCYIKHNLQGAVALIDQRYLVMTHQ